MAVGVAAAVLACLLWGGTFVAPLLAPEVPSVLLSAGRFAAFGLVSAAVLSLAGRRGEGWRAPAAAAWGQAAALSLAGNLGYYAALAAATAVRLAGPALPALVIGLLPITMALAGRRTEGGPPWRTPAAPLALAGTGLALVTGTRCWRRPARAAAEPGRRWEARCSPSPRWRSGRPTAWPTPPS